MTFQREFTKIHRHIDTVDIMNGFQNDEILDKRCDVPLKNQCYIRIICIFISFSVFLFRIIYVCVGGAEDIS